jgi:hypothetical protein
VHSRDASFTSSSETRRAWLALSLPCIVVLALFLLGLYVFRGELAEIGRGQGAAERGALRRVQKWARQPGAAPRVVLFGDSLAVCADAKKHAVASVGRATVEGLRRGGLRVDLVDLAQPALRPLHYYALLDDALALRPALVIVEINPRGFLPVAAGGGAERMPALARKLSLREAIRVRASLEQEGLTLLDPLLMQLEEQLGMLYVLEGARDAVAVWLEQQAARLESALGLHREPLASLIEAERRLVLSYMVDHAAHPNAAVLRAIRDDFVRAGVPVLFYVAPIDVARLRDAGLADPPALQASFERLRVAVGATRGEWLDLHAVLTSSSFRDRQNHLRLAACDDVGRHLARRARDVLATRPAR